MPKKIDYPQASITKSIELAEAVYALGGNSSMDMCAEQMGRKVGGGFKAIVSAATKFGLITNTRGQLAITDLFKYYHLGYSPEEKKQILQKAFLHVPLFLEIYERFKSQELPVKIFDKLLIREFNVNQQDASRVAKYFVDGAKSTVLLNSDNTFCFVDGDTQEMMDDESSFDEPPAEETGTQQAVVKDKVDCAPIDLPDIDEFSVKISGPGINSTIIIREEEDLDIVEVMLKKVKKKLLEVVKKTKGH